MSLSHPDLSSRILSSAFRVQNTLGRGHLEHVYQNALAHCLRRLGLRVRLEARIPVEFEGVAVGFCEADLIVEDLFVVECNAAETILPGHEARLRAYLRASGIEDGILLNFGLVKVDVRRLTQTRMKAG